MKPLFEYIEQAHSYLTRPAILGTSNYLGLSSSSNNSEAVPLYDNPYVVVAFMACCVFFTFVLARIVEWFVGWILFASRSQPQSTTTFPSQHKAKQLEKRRKLFEEYDREKKKRETAVAAVTSTTAESLSNINENSPQTSRSGDNGESCKSLNRKTIPCKTVDCGTISREMCVDEDGRPESRGIDSLESISQWMARMPSPDPYNIAVIPLRPRAIDTSQQRLLVCHDMMGGYCEDKFPQGSDEKEVYRIYAWQTIDLFVYFSHKLVTIPPPCWTNVGHRNGTRVLGTFITEWERGAMICEKVFGTLFKAEELATRLACIAKYYGFDGWLINIENPLKAAYIPNVQAFLKRLKSILTTYNPTSVVIWYDSVTTEGDLRWQNELNTLNEPFFGCTDGIFLNYFWNEGQLKRSANVAKAFYRKDRRLDVYAGVDVFGRNTYGGGKWNCADAYRVIRAQGLSCALFAPGWVYENLDRSCFEYNQEKFWRTVHEYFGTRRVCALPFCTNFDRGAGSAQYLNGACVSSKPWSNISHQSILPTEFFNVEKNPYLLGTPSLDLRAEWCTEHAYNGGTSLKISGKVSPSMKAIQLGSRAVFRLFKTNIKLDGPIIITITYTTPRGPIEPKLLMCIDDPKVPYLSLATHSSGRAKIEGNMSIDAKLLERYGARRSPSYIEGSYCHFSPSFNPEEIIEMSSLSHGNETTKHMYKWNTAHFVLCERFLKDVILKELRLCCAITSPEGIRKPGEVDVSLNIGEIRILPLRRLKPAVHVSGIQVSEVAWHISGSGIMRRIQVGSSGTNIKRVHLPFEGMVVCDSTPANEQQHGWRDRFHAEVHGNTLVVRRTDSNEGWGQDLVLLVEDPVNKDGTHDISVSFTLTWTQSEMTSHCNIISPEGREKDVLLGRAHAPIFRVTKYLVAQKVKLGSRKNAAVNLCVQAVDVFGCSTALASAPKIRLEYEH
eukprot:UC4_evm2s1556